jgi:hypothetical protein
MQIGRHAVAVLVLRSQLGLQLDNSRAVARRLEGYLLPVAPVELQ